MIVLSKTFSIDLGTVQAISNIKKGTYLRVRSVPLGVDGGEVPALLDGDLEAARAEAVEHAELDVAADVDGAVAAALLRVHRRHRLGTGLKTVNTCMIRLLFVLNLHLLINTS